MTPQLTPMAWKEIRALWPAWSLSMFVLCVDALTGSWWLLEGGLGAYVIGSILIGAQTMGHEYSERTLGVLLSQPSDRRRLLGTKLAVLAAMLVALAALAYPVLFVNPQSRLAEILSDPALLPLPIALGVFVAPWMTMLGRSGLAGVVFTIAIPGTILVATEAIGALTYGAASAQVDDFKLAVWPKALLVFCAVGAVLGWRTFMRLEAIEGTGEDIHLTRWVGAGRPRAGSPVWRLVKKEFHLQQLTLVLVGLYLAGWIAVAAFKHLMPEFRSVVFIPATTLYLVLLSMLTGSLASAEERQLGTLEWHMLLPMAAWQQWLVKAGTVLALAFAFGIGLPALIIYLDPSDTAFRDALGVSRQIMIVLLATGSLYVSSVSPSGLRALVAAFPAVFATAVLVFSTMNFVWRTFARLMLDPAGPRLSVRVQPTLPAAAYDAIFAALVGGFVLLLLVLAFQNHRSADRRLGRVFRQIACITAFLVAGVILWAGVLVWSYSG